MQKLLMFLVIHEWSQIGMVEKMSTASKKMP